MVPGVGTPFVVVEVVVLLLTLVVKQEQDFGPGLHRKVLWEPHARGYGRFLQFEMCTWFDSRKESRES